MNRKQTTKTSFPFPTFENSASRYFQCVNKFAQLVLLNCEWIEVTSIMNVISLSPLHKDNKMYLIEAGVVRG